MPDVPAVCAHEQFEHDAKVYRLTESAAGDPVAYRIVVKVRCADCLEQFVFRGLPMGLSQQQPTMNLTGDELAAPIAPASRPDAGLLLPGFDVKVWVPE